MAFVCCVPCWCYIVIGVWVRFSYSLCGLWWDACFASACTPCRWALRYWVGRLLLGLVVFLIVAAAITLWIAASFHGQQAG
jgi:hypothetical protein